MNLLITRKILLNIKPIDEQYTLDYLSCFEKPMGIAAEGLKQHSSSWLYIYLKFILSYNTDETRDIDFFDLCGKILSNLGMQIYLNEPEDDDDLHKIIKKEINLNRPVLLLGNLKAIPYSIYYHESDWPHLYLIYGYDEMKKIYYIIDGTQIKKSIHIYDEFVLEYHIIEKTYLSYMKTYDFKLIYSINRDDNKIEELILLNNFFEFIKEKKTAQPYFEVDLMHEYNNLTDSEMNDYFLNLWQIHKHKRVMFQQIISVFRRIKKEDREIIDIEEAMDTVTATWKKAIIKFSLDIRRNKILCIDDYVLYPIELEKKLLISMNQMNEKIQFEFNCEKKIGETLTNQWSFENNKDSIISIKNEQLQFSFCSHKLYNSWVNDESPKAFINNTDLLNNDFVFQTKMSVEIDDDKVFFHGGIVFKTTAGNLYYWGIHCGDIIILSKMGNSTPYSLALLDTLTIYLRIRKEGSTYYFGYSEDSIGTFTDIYITEELGEIQLLGVGCKTWEEVRNINIVFSEFESVSNPLLT